MKVIQIDWCDWLVACYKAGMTSVWESNWSVIINSQSFFIQSIESTVDSTVSKANTVIDSTVSKATK